MDILKLIVTEKWYVTAYLVFKPYILFYINGYAFCILQL